MTKRIQGAVQLQAQLWGLQGTAVAMQMERKRAEEEARRRAEDAKRDAEREEARRRAEADTELKVRYYEVSCAAHTSRFLCGHYVPPASCCMAATAEPMQQPPSAQAHGCAICGRARTPQRERAVLRLC